MTCPTPTGYVSVPCTNHTPFPQHLHSLASTGVDIAIPLLVIAVLLFIGFVLLQVRRSRRAK